LEVTITITITRTSIDCATETLLSAPDDVIG